jgi:hypothetical protein
MGLHDRAKQAAENDAEAQEREYFAQFDRLARRHRPDEEQCAKQTSQALADAENWFSVIHEAFDPAIIEVYSISQTWSEWEDKDGWTSAKREVVHQAETVLTWSLDGETFWGSDLYESGAFSVYMAMAPHLRLLGRDYDTSNYEFANNLLEIEKALKHKALLAERGRLPKPSWQS